MEEEEISPAERMARNRAEDFRFKQEAQRQMGRAIVDTAKKVFHEHGEKLKEGEVEEVLTEEPPEDPDFPYAILFLALFKDFGDFFFTPTGILIILSYIGSFSVTIILIMWFKGKIKGRMWKKVILKKLWGRIIFLAGLEYIPILQIVPATTIFVYMAHYRQKEIVIMFNLFLEELHNRKLI